MRILLSIYIFICIMLFLFNIGFLMIKNIKKEKLLSKNRDIEEKLISELKKYSENNGFNRKFKKYISKKLKKLKT